MSSWQLVLATLLAWGLVLGGAVLIAECGLS